MEITGLIKVIEPTQKVSTSFKKRNIVVSTDEQFVQHIIIEFNQDKCDLLDKFKLGDSVKVGINLGGREWVNPQGETKYFNSIKGWKIEKLESDNIDVSKVPAQPFEQVTNVIEEVEDDLPF